MKRVYRGAVYTLGVLLLALGITRNTKAGLGMSPMTPYAWKTPKEGIARLFALDELETEIGFDLHVYQRL